MEWMNSAFLALLFLLEGVVGGQYCESSDYDLSNFRYKTTYCEYGCCFFSCCSVAVVIVPCVIGGIILIAVIIAVVCCCCPQCSQKKGRVVSPHGQTNLAYNQQAYNQQSPMYHQGNYLNNPGVQPVPTLLQPPMQQNNVRGQYPENVVYQYPLSNQQQFPPMPQPDYNARGNQPPPQPPTYFTPSAPPPPYPY
ncbi:hypothetical protein ACJMK2_017235 [Sinanodonta woodiana]|uniref:Uncharacterized protein n=1 Tax=Sinanodonta woodiana TaxID=1069815 RepID=A0ABD3UW85_SINWO